jgi:hypothetical protein
LDSNKFMDIWNEVGQAFLQTAHIAPMAYRIENPWKTWMVNRVENIHEFDHNDKRNS